MEPAEATFAKTVSQYGGAEDLVLPRGMSTEKKRKKNIMLLG